MPRHASKLLSYNSLPIMGIGGGRCRGRTEVSGGDEGALSFPEEIEEVVVRPCLSCVLLLPLLTEGLDSDS